MELNEFVKLFADQFEETDPNEIKSETSFHDLEEWSSMTALSVMNMVGKKCNVCLTFEEIKSLVTVKQLYDYILLK